jgi:protein-tyrosine-phosphatase
MKILFVCRGNVGRSQFGEAMFKKYVQGNYEVSSAGTKLSGPEQPISELPLAENVIDTMKEEGIDISGNYRTQLTEAMFDDADKVVLVMDDDDPIPDYVQNSSKVIHWDVPDPKGTDLQRHRDVRDIIKQKIINTTF